MTSDVRAVTLTKLYKISTIQLDINISVVSLEAEEMLNSIEFMFFKRHKDIYLYLDS